MSRLHSRLPLRSLYIDLLRRPSTVDRSAASIRKRIYRTFIYREAVFRICCSSFEAVTEEIVRQRHILEEYLILHPEFHRSLEPLDPHPDAPDVAKRMAKGARPVGVGPMAAVAGTMAQLAAEAGIKAGAEEAIIENGGDIYLDTAEPVIIGLHTGTLKLADQLAFSLKKDDTPLAICSSSGKMGHSMSKGECDLATVVAKEAALADAAATMAANLVSKEEEVDKALESIGSIIGVDGIMIIKNDRIGLAGKLPDLVKVPI